MRNSKIQEWRILLDEKALKYNNHSFIPQDPVSIPHRYTKPQDIEIAGLFAALLAWGQRVTILKNLDKLMKLMDNVPHDFIVNHEEKERQRFAGFIHRTFNDTDLLYFIEFLQSHYRQSNSLEILFSGGLLPTDTHTGPALSHFHHAFFALPHLRRTEKHVSTPDRKSACKRLNLFLRWMVRYDNNGVDFGIWKSIRPAQLLCPLDVHVQRAAISLGLLKRKQADWMAVLELTKMLRKLDADDPVRYDFALFGLSIEGHF